MIGVAEIMQKLPYRHPMLLVDRVTEVVPGERLTALKAVTASEPWFRECPLNDPDMAVGTAPVVFPAVLLIESLCQAAGLLAAWDAPKPSVLSGEVMLLGSLSDVTVQASVEPGSVICHHVRLVRGFGDTLIFDGTSAVDGHPVLRVGHMVMAIRPAEVVTAHATAAAAASGTAGLLRKGL